MFLTLKSTVQALVLFVKSITSTIRRKRPKAVVRPGRRRRGSEHTAPRRVQTGVGLICGDHCTDPDQIRWRWTKLPSFPLVVAAWERRLLSGRLTDSGAER